MINIPQAIFSYPGGACGEWLAIQIGNHDKYYQYHNGELTGDANEFNRWRIRGSWRSWALENTNFKKEVWFGDTLQYTGTDAWWKQFEDTVPDTEKYYTAITQLINSDKRQWRIPVHRCHEGWFDVFWQRIFTEVKIVTISVDKNDPIGWKQFQGNVIKKIFWQDLQGEDLKDELVDKCRKYKVDYNEVMTYLNRLPMPIKYADMIVGLMTVGKLHNLEDGVEAAYKHMASRWSDNNIIPYSKPIPGGHTINFRLMFVERSYPEYQRLCDYLACTPWTKDVWQQFLSSYTDPDSKQVITPDELKERLWQTAADMI